MSLQQLEVILDSLISTLKFKQYSWKKCMIWWILLTDIYDTTTD